MILTLQYIIFSALKWLDSKILNMKLQLIGFFNYLNNLNNFFTCLSLIIDLIIRL